ncbi:MAG: response regulator transcription factor, partial [Actinomycetota bacterium]
MTERSNQPIGTGGPDRPTVVIGDDDLSIRQDFRRLLEHDGRFDVIGTANDGHDLVAVVTESRPDVAVVDVRMPRATGIEATAAIVEGTATAVLIVTTFDLDRDVRAAIRAGASGFLLKNEAADHLADAVAAVADGQQVYNAVAIGTLVDALTDDVL